MGFNWERFIDVADHLSNYSKKEEYQRSAVGRYYYAAYLNAREIYNKKRNKKDGSRISHKNLISSFEHSNDYNEQIIGKKLRELRNFRNNADYDKKFVFKNLPESRNLSHELLKLIRKINDGVKNDK